MISVSIKKARIRYQDSLLFDKLELMLVAGEWTCLLGQSGIGKSSLLRLLAGLLNDEGQGNIQCNDGQTLHGRVAYMAQTDLLMPWLTALQNVLVGVRLRGEVNQGDIDRAMALLHQVGLGEDTDRYPAKLSGGMRQRVALARTLFEDKPVILMDEPFSALDAITRHRLQTLAAELLQDKTILLVTHDPLEALRLGHRIYILGGGPPAVLSLPIVPQDPPPRAMDHPQVGSLQAEIWQRLAA